MHCRRIGERRAPSRHLRNCAGAEKDRKSTRLNSSHSQISYAVFCLKKKKTTNVEIHRIRSFRRSLLRLSTTSSLSSVYRSSQDILQRLSEGLTLFQNLTWV